MDLNKYDEISNKLLQVIDSFDKTNGIHPTRLVASYEIEPGVDGNQQCLSIYTNNPRNLEGDIIMTASVIHALCRYHDIDLDEYLDRVIEVCDQTAQLSKQSPATQEDKHLWS